LSAGISEEREERDVEWKVIARVTLVIGFLVMCAGRTADTASAAAYPGTYYFHDCSGPAGTPSSFTALRENMLTAAGERSAAGVAFRLIGGGVFIALQFGDTPIAKGIPAGNLTTSCLVDFAPPVGTLPVTGFIASGG
jgi:hypothetical protein